MASWDPDLYLEEFRQQRDRSNDETAAFGYALTRAVNDWSILARSPVPSAPLPANPGAALLSGELGDDEIFALAERSGWNADRRASMTPADARQWCDQMRAFVTNVLQLQAEASAGVQRRRFEAAWKAGFGWPEHAIMRVLPDGHYLNPEIERAWRLWQASANAQEGSLRQLRLLIDKALRLWRDDRPLDTCGDLEQQLAAAAALPAPAQAPDTTQSNPRTGRVAAANDAARTCFPDRTGGELHGHNMGMDDGPADHPTPDMTVFARVIPD